MEAKPSTTATYKSVTGYFTTPASATDVVFFKGSSSKTVDILRVKLIQTQYAYGKANYYLVKRSTADTGGTGTALTVVPLDSGFAAGTASGTYYTANPTLGTAVGTVAHDSIALMAGYGGYGASGQDISVVLFDIDKYGAPITLRGTSEGVGVNFNGVTNPISTSVSVEITWQER